MSLPLAAVALALFMSSWGNGVMKAHAALDPTVKFSISAPGCSSTGVPTAKCTVALGSTFTLAFNIDALPTNPGGTPPNSYDGYDSNLTYTAGLVTGPTVGPGTPGPTPPKGLFQTGAGNMPGCVFNASDFTTPGVVAAGCGIGIGAASATYVGSLYHLVFTCAATPAAGHTETITLVAGPGKTDVVDQASVSHNQAANQSLTINCNPAPTATPPPPTPTPPAVPRVFKTCSSPNAPTGPLCNVFLHRQGTKIPPTTCEAGTDVATLKEGISSSITTQDPKGITGFQQLAAFEFQVRFDPSLVCVSITAGPDWTLANGAICSALVNKGLIRFGCATIGKGHNLNATVPAHPLAIISVRPQPELYSQLRPNQDNGIPVQILNQGCQLTDEQGHSIPIFSCEDADITFRFLEGDVDGPDCDVDVLDAQQVAFRWGASKGALLYNSFMDLMPSGQVKGDGRIDISDLQFVFGRLGSTCTQPWPPQPPVNPKA